MPRRYVCFKNDRIYHIFDKTIDSIQVFSTKSIAQRFLSTLVYYRSNKSRLRYSYLKICRKEIFEKLMKEVYKEATFKTQILAYCFMPNHYHLLVRQVRNGGIHNMMRRSLDSITRLYNTIHKRNGPLFLPLFKAKYIRSEEQLIYTSRYIHLNPYEAGLVPKLEDIYSYHFSSVRVYINGTNPYHIDSSPVMQSPQFKGDTSKYRRYLESLSRPV